MDNKKCIDLFPADDLSDLPRDRFAFWCTGYKRPPGSFCATVVLTTHSLNKGLAFTREERELLRIRGLLPYVVRTLDEQVHQYMTLLRSIENEISKIFLLRRIESVNSRLFYTLLKKHFNELWPLLSPRAIKYNKYLNYYMPRCAFISIKDRGHVYDIFKNWPEPVIRDIVLSDGEFVPKYGDVGAYCFTSIVSKAYLHTALAGIKPNWNLSVYFDVGTDNEELLNDKLYIGLRQKRVRGKEYFDLIDEFMKTCVRCWGLRVTIIFDDLNLSNGLEVLLKYRHYNCVMSMNIQCMGGLGLAIILASAKISKTKITDYKILIYKCKPSSLGIATLTKTYFKKEKLSVASPIWFFDTDGLIVDSRKEESPAYLKEFAQHHEPITSLMDAINILKPNVIIGSSDEGNTFDIEVLRALEANTETPVIISLSNAQPECTAEDAFTYTKGKCIFVGNEDSATVKYANKIYEPSTFNPIFISAGITMGVMSSGVPTIPDEIFIAAAERLADLVPPDSLAKRSVLPPMEYLQCCCEQIADAVMATGYKLKIASLFPEPKNRVDYIKDQRYDLGYEKIMPQTYQVD